MNGGAIVVFVFVVCVFLFGDGGVVNGGGGGFGGVDGVTAVVLAAVAMLVSPLLLLSSRCVTLFLSCCAVPGPASP